MDFNYLDFELSQHLTAETPELPTDAFRLPNGQTVLLSRNANRVGHARITLLTSTVSKSWLYLSETEAEAALAAWEPDIASGPSGWCSSSELSSKPAA